jgi:Xaa-Pro aminopeptidase
MKTRLAQQPGSSARRSFLRAGFAGATTIAVLPATLAAAREGRHVDAARLPRAFAALEPLGDRVRPIAADEYRTRLSTAQRLMAESSPTLGALLVAPGSTLQYFTGIRWSISERLLALVLPRDGEPLLVVPAFEEGRLREQLPFPIEVRAWAEDENPFALTAASLADRGVRAGPVGVDAATRFGFVDRLRAATPSLGLAAAESVTGGCRERKSAHELELMRLACAATCDVFRAVFASLESGMTQLEVARLVEAGFARMGQSGEALVLFGASAALPHGTRQPQTLKRGDVVLIDGGCSVEGYQSDVTRTGVFGPASARVAAAFGIVRAAQDAALEAARAGRAAGSVDDAARAVISRAGYGPGYRYFTHRLGHGIGMDGHESPYLVRGNGTLLAPGMTFSNEPGIYVPGEFGLRCEDDMVITAEGPARLLTPHFQLSLEHPLA